MLPATMDGPLDGSRLYSCCSIAGVCRRHCIVDSVVNVVVVVAVAFGSILQLLYTIAKRILY